MKFVFFHFLHPNRLECSQADVQSNFRSFDSLLSDAREDFWREVKTSGGRGDGTTLARVHGLIAIVIVR